MEVEYKNKYQYLIKYKVFAYKQLAISFAAYEGITFKTENNVWLVDCMPTKYIDKIPNTYAKPLTDLFNANLYCL